MFDLFGLPLVALACVAPAVAAVSAILYATSPVRQRDATVRGALIVSVSLTAIELLVGALIVGFLLVLRATGGGEDF